jgi:hypothetical protein
VATFVVGDVHGHRDTLAALLRDAGLVDASDRWCGADARLWLLGDLVDRGPDGVGAIELVIGLQREGDVRCLLGNHELLLLGVTRHANAPIEDTDVTWGESWTSNGGRSSDLRGLEERHRSWIEGLSPLARDGDWLLLHADTLRYLELGSGADEIVGTTAQLLAGGDPADLAALLGIVSDRHGFHEPGRAAALLDRLGGTRVVHGHTPIFFVAGREPDTVTEPLVYADGVAVNADHCLFAGGPGFVVRLDGEAWELATPPG